MRRRSHNADTIIRDIDAHQCWCGRLTPHRRDGELAFVVVDHQVSTGEEHASNSGHGIVLRVRVAYDKNVLQRGISLDPPIRGDIGFIEHKLLIRYRNSNGVVDGSREVSGKVSVTC
jgi:hypothetical protein